LIDDLNTTLFFAIVLAVAVGSLWLFKRLSRLLRQPMRLVRAGLDWLLEMFASSGGFAWLCLTVAQVLSLLGCLAAIGATFVALRESRPLLHLYEEWTGNRPAVLVMRILAEGLLSLLFSYGCFLAFTRAKAQAPAAPEDDQGRA
jgi:hypothetical protein